MTISPERVTNACNAYCGISRNAAHAILQADDAFTSTIHGVNSSTSPAPPAPTVEPVLPAWLMFNGDEYLFNNGSTDSPKIINFSPEALRMVADHADWRWRESQQRQAEPVVKTPYSAAYEVLRESNDDEYAENIAKAIAAALAAAPGKKEGES